MKSTACIALCLACLGPAQAVVIDVTGGVVTLSNGGTGVPANDTYWTDVVSFEQHGLRFRFIGAHGIVGDYYAIGAGAVGGNDVLHAHWDDGLVEIVVERTDGAAFDLSYFELTSNTQTGGGQSTGAERSYLTASNGSRLTLPSSDWGDAFDYYGDPGDGVARIVLGPAFSGITSFVVTSDNAFCFGMDNFYIDEAAPPVPEPASALLLGAGLAALGAAVARLRRRA